jgi:hypothetical protein
MNLPQTIRHAVTLALDDRDMFLRKGRANELRNRGRGLGGKF